MKIALKVLLTVIIVIVIALIGLVAWLSLVEYKPSDVQALAVGSASTESKTVKLDQSMTLLSWNIGYGGLGKDEDFFMDGGKTARPSSKEVVNTYLDGIVQTIHENNADLVLLQEVDEDCTRTYGIDERPILKADMGYDSFALNYSCPFVPVPFPPMGKVNSGLYTFTDNYEVTSANRISLYCPFSWPVRVVNLKRCLLVSYLPIEGSDKQLVLVNLHLEAYTANEERETQTKQLLDLITAEYAKGNYVITGGDFNQFFPGSRELYPEMGVEWNPGELNTDLLPEGWTLAYDLSVPTCRSLDRPYDPTDETTQYYSIDGLILSPNVKLIEVKTLDEGFENSDHNPVRLQFSLVSGK